MSSRLAPEGWLFFEPTPIPRPASRPVSPRCRRPPRCEPCFNWRIKSTPGDRTTVSRTEGRAWRPTAVRSSLCQGRTASNSRGSSPAHGATYASGCFRMTGAHPACLCRIIVQSERRQLDRNPIRDPGRYSVLGKGRAILVIWDSNAHWLPSNSGWPDRL
jgi:hypothetical protein